MAGNGTQTAPVQETNALTTEPMDRLSDAVVSDWL